MLSEKPGSSEMSELLTSGTAQTKPFKNKIQYLLVALIVVGLISTLIISSVSWWTSSNLAQSIDALGKNSKILAEGNLAISNTIANYLDRQERIVSAQSPENLALLENKLAIQEDFEQQYQTLLVGLESLDTSELQSLNAAFSRFDQFDNDLFRLKTESFDFEQSVLVRTAEVIAITERTQTFANSLAVKVKKYEREKAEKIKASNDSITQADEKETFSLFGLFFSENEHLKRPKIDNKVAERVSEAMVDKNFQGDQAKSLISLHINTLERLTQKILLAKEIKDLENIKLLDVKPELVSLNLILARVSQIDIEIEDYESIISAILTDVEKLSQELTGASDSLYASKLNMLIMDHDFTSLQKNLKQSRADLLLSLEKISHSGDMLAHGTKLHAADVVKNSRDAIIGIGVSVLFIFLLFGHAIAKRINTMARQIKMQSDHMARANEIITKAHHELQESNAMVTESIGYARRIQRAIQSSGQGLGSFCQDSFILWQPRDIVGGDVYLVRQWGDGNLILFADCTGHGVPGAFITILVKSALDRALQTVSLGRTGKLITTMHQIIQMDLGQNRVESIADDGLDLAICYITPSNNHLIFSGAKLSLLYRSKFGLKELKELKELKGEKSSIGYQGIDPNISFSEQHLDFAEETDCYLFTDGIIDQIGGSRLISFGRRRLFNIIEDVATKKMSEQADVFLTALTHYQGAEERRDDITMIGFTLGPELLTRDSSDRKNEKVRLGEPSNCAI